MIWACRVGLVVLVVAVPGLMSVPAASQTALEDSVLSRPRPDDPIGIVAGPYDSFLFFPKLEVGTEFTDNLFSDTVGKKADFAVVLKPSFKYRSDWDNHSVEVTGQAENTRYYDNIDENSLDYGLSVAGRLDVREKTEISSTLKFDRKHQDRGDPDDEVGGIFEGDLTIFRVATLSLGAKYNPDVILLKLDTEATYSDFDDAGATNNDDRDRLEFEARGRVGYEWVPGSTAFIETAIDIREFDKEIDDNGFKRSSDGFEILLGNTLDLSGVTFVEFGVGYIRQDFPDQVAGSPNLGPTKGISFKGDLIWNPTDLLTVTSKMRREVRETTVPGAASAFTSTFDLGVDYDMFDNFILGTKAKYSIESFDGIDQTDTSTNLELNAKYFIGPNYVGKARYLYKERVTDDPDGGFIGNSFMLSIVVQL